MVNSICAQINNIYVDTVVYTHSKYNDLEQEVVIKNYFLSETDYDLLTSEKTRLRVRNGILSKYKSHDFTLFYNGSKNVSPYDLFGLETNMTEYDFVFPLSTYIIDMESFKNMFLHDKYKRAEHWGLQSVVLYFFSGEKLIEKISTSFPIFKSKIIDFAKKSTRFVLEIRNKYDDSLKVEFFIKSKL